MDEAGDSWYNHHTENILSPNWVQPDDGTLLWFDRIRVSNYTCVCNPRPHCLFFIARKRENGKRSAQD